MNRRQLLRGLLGIPAVLASAELVELLAPRRTIFLPPEAGWVTRQTRYIKTAEWTWTNETIPHDFYIAVSGEAYARVEEHSKNGQCKTTWFFDLNPDNLKIELT